MHDGSWLAAGRLRYYECLDAEAPHEKLVTLSVSIGLDVALIPSQAKRRIWNLDHKEIKRGIRWKPPLSTVITSTGPRDVTLTAAWAFGMQLAATAPAERTIGEVDPVIEGCRDCFGCCDFFVCRGCSHRPSKGHSD